MKHHSDVGVYQFSWSNMVTAFWKRYPNPFSTHVLTEDVVDRRVSGNQLITKRLICKTSSLPGWAEKITGKINEVYLIEESVLDLDSKTFTTNTRNISLQNVMTTVENCVYSTSTGNQTVTQCHRNAWFDSKVYGFGGMIASYGLQSYKKNIVKTTNGYTYVLNSMFGENKDIKLKNSETNETGGSQKAKKGIYGKEALTLKSNYNI